MAVTFDTSGSLISNNSTTRDVSITVGAGSDRALVAFVTRYDGTTSASSVAVTTGGYGDSRDQFTFLGKCLYPITGMIEIWYLVNPPSGSITIRSTLPSSPSNEHGLAVMSFAGVSQSNPIDNFTSATTTGGFGAIASSANNMVVCGISDAANRTITNGTVAETGVWQQFDDFAYSVGSASFQWTFSGTEGGNAGVVGANINEVGATQTLMGQIWM